jgi:hypothetical protein
MKQNLGYVHSRINVTVVSSDDKNWYSLSITLEISVKWCGEEDDEWWVGKDSNRGGCKLSESTVLAFMCRLDSNQMRSKLWICQYKITVLAHSNLHRIYLLITCNEINFQLYIFAIVLKLSRSFITFEVLGAMNVKILDLVPFSSVDRYSISWDLQALKFSYSKLIPVQNLVNF